MSPAVNVPRHRHAMSTTRPTPQSASSSPPASIASGNTCAADPPCSTASGPGTSRRDPFRSLDELLRLAGFKVAPSAGDRRGAAPPRRHRRREPLAARIVLQRLLPGLLAIVRREQQRDRDVDAFDLLAAEAWLAIVTYRADLRPTDVAARLLNDARHRAFTTPRRRQERSREDVVPPARLDLPRLPQPGSSFEELTIVLRDARQDGSATTTWPPSVTTSPDQRRRPAAATQRQRPHRCATAAAAPSSRSAASPPSQAGW